MKFSKLWLKEQIAFDMSTEELTEKLTMVGLEVDAVEPVVPNFHGVVVGKVIEVTPHPNADKLSLCKVNVGDVRDLDIVCGASNVRSGLKVPVALVGSILPDNFKIKKAKLRGVDSEGMLCAAVELGLPDTDGGILELPSDAPIGADIREYLLLDDEVIEIELTANRGDCLSIRGVAREVAAINPNAKLKPLKASEFKFGSEVFPVTLQAKEACPRYSGRIIRGVNNSINTPVWMKEYLRRLGIKSINFIVDVTNYTMLELGQPLHAYDLSKLDQGIVVRYAESGEKILLLDGNEIELNSKTLVIADSSKCLAIAGVMGGSDTGVFAETRDIFLESAFFIPEKISVEARNYGLQTDSSYRFERGVDYELQLKALDRATSLILEIAGGDPGDLQEVRAEDYMPKRSDLILRRDSVQDILGISIEDDKIFSILSRLGMKVEVVSEGWGVTIPSWRFDLKIEVDLIEELARIYGYHLIPEQKIAIELGYNGNISEKNDRDRLHSLMEDIGYHEVITYSFIDEKLQELFGNGELALPLANPISSELSVMRTTLLPGLVSAVKYNLKRQQKRARFFEIGMRFLQKKEGLEQKFAIAGVVCGDLYPEQWGIEQKNNQADFFDLKNDVNAILQLFVSGDIEYLPQPHSALHPKRCARIYLAKEPIGFIGQLHPLVKERFDLDKTIYLFELDLDHLTNKAKTIFKPFSRYPQVTRDIAIIVDKEIAWSKIRQKIVDISGELLHNVLIFDVYCNENIGLDRRSMAIRLVFQSVDRTLVDAEVGELVERIVLMLKETFNASLRG